MIMLFYAVRFLCVLQNKIATR